MEIIGRIIHLGEVIKGTSKTGNEWKKRDVVIETIEQYSNKVCLNVWSDNTEHSLLQIGATLKFSIAIQSREYNGKWYTDVKVIRFESDVNTQNNTNLPKPGSEGFTDIELGENNDSESETDPWPF